MEIQSALASGMCGAGHAMARWPRTVFMFGAMTCLFVSAAAHLLASHSRRFNRLFWQLNYAGYGELFSRYIDDPDFQFSRLSLIELNLFVKLTNLDCTSLFMYACPLTSLSGIKKGELKILSQLHCQNLIMTTSPKGGAYLYNVHFWIRKDSSQDEAATGAIKTVELDSVLGGRAV
ncbi:Villin-2 [Hordeum vulgare]|nr:Villin-2 [Hordeum vulgare]